MKSLDQHVSLAQQNQALHIESLCRQAAERGPWVRVAIGPMERDGAMSFKQGYVFLEDPRSPVLPGWTVYGPFGALGAAVTKLGATAADGIPGLWNVPGHPELTTGQLLDLASRS